MSQDFVTKGNLPHWYKPGFAHFVTYRLAGSVPNHLIQQWRQDRLAAFEKLGAEGSSGDARERLQKRFFQKYDDYLDQSDSIRWLANSEVAEIVRENLYHHHGKKFQLLSWCIMPNHVHVLIQPFEGIQMVEVDFSGEVADSRSPLTGIMHSLKSYTANQANRVLNRSGSFWQTESYDHWVRSVAELERIHAYIQLNPVKAGLCEHPKEWLFSSSHDRFEIDQSTCGYVGQLTDNWRRC